MVITADELAKSFKSTWAEWDLRSFVLLSLFVQFILTFAAPFRKITANTLVVVSIWLSYQLADWLASYAMGLMPSKGNKSCPCVCSANSTTTSAATSDDRYGHLQAFWAPFLLLHLGGPDTITALTLEDNALWMRSALQLLAQGYATLRVFLQYSASLQQHNLWIPIVLMFMVGIIKYVERVLSLFGAHLDKFRESLLKEPDPGPDYAEVMEEYKRNKENNVPQSLGMLIEPVAHYRDPGEDHNNGQYNGERRTSSSESEDIVSESLEPSDDRNDDSSNRESQQDSILEESETEEEEEEEEEEEGGLEPQEVYLTMVPEAVLNFRDPEEDQNNDYDSGGANGGDHMRAKKVGRRGLSNLQLTKDAHEFFQIFKGLFVDSIFTFHDRSRSQQYFMNRNPRDAFRVLEIELNCAYEVFYTKAPVIHRCKGYITRVVCFLMEITALGLWVFTDKDDFRKFDIWITYTLLIAAISLEIMSFFMFLLSDETFVRVGGYKDRFCVASLWTKLLSLGWKRTWTQDSREKGESYQHMKSHSSHILSRRWSESISQLSLIDFCSNERNQGIDQLYKSLGVKDLLDSKRYIFPKRLTTLMRDFIVEELKRKTSSVDIREAKDIYLARGEWILQDYEKSTNMSAEALLELQKLRTTWIEKVDYDESLILWHIATELLYSVQDDNTSALNDHLHRSDRKLSKILSRYMLYLLIKKPMMMMLVAGISEIRFRDTCAEAKRFFRRVLKDSYQDIHTTYKGKKSRKVMVKLGSVKLMDVETDFDPKDIKGDRSKSLLFEAVRLAKHLKGLKEKMDINMWELISKVWLELLCYASTNCRPNAHASQLCKGGELLTLVWLLMVHLGLGNQFRVDKGQARVKIMTG